MYFPSFQLAKLTPEDMKAVKNMRMLEGTDSKKAANGSFSLKFDAQKQVIVIVVKTFIEDPYRSLHT